MTITLRAPETQDLTPRITVLGVGGAGGNAVNNMIGAKLEGVSFVVANTDAQALAQSKADLKIQLGAKLTEGLGAGAKPDVGRAAAEESLADILDALSGAHMVFITAGMGGGTGTGAAPVIARAVRELGILTVGVVTKPFNFEGDKRMRLAEGGIEDMQRFVDTLIVIPNQNLFRVANERTTFAQAFAMADEVLHSGVRGITDLIVMPGLINRDFADIKTVMSEMGKAMMGTGETAGEGRAIKAAEAAISNPLLDDVSMQGARAVLINVTGGPDLMLFEVDEAVNRIRQEVDPDANILFGSALSESMEGRVRVSVVATGIEAEEMARGLRSKVQRLHPRRANGEIAMAPLPMSGPAPIEEASVSPIRTTMENIAHELGAETEMAHEPAFDAGPVAINEAFDLGGSDAPILDDSAQAEPRPMSDFARIAPQPERPRRRFGLFGRKRERVEPAMEAPPQPRMQPVEPERAMSMKARRGPEAAEAKAPPTEDLFPEVSEDDRFEIPAFLRRQANSGG
jgi:cell division protein FtsZ